MAKKPVLQVKIPKGTIVKVEGHPVQIKESWFVPMPDNFLDDHTIMEAEDK